MFKHLAILAVLFVALIAAIISIGFWNVNNVAEAGGGGPYVTIDMPETAVYGHQPVTFKVNIVNAGSTKINFTGVVWHGGPAWGWESYGQEVSAGTRILWNDAGGSYWQGEVEAGKTATYSQQTFTGTTLGTNTLVKAAFIVAQDQSTIKAEKEITLTQGTEHKVTWSFDPPVVKPGGSTQIRLILEAPMLTQFSVVEPLKSTCGLQSLENLITKPNPQWMDPFRTYFSYYMIQVLSASTPSGPCQISGVVTTREGFRLPLNATLEIEGTTPTPSPTATTTPPSPTATPTVATMPQIALSKMGTWQAGSLGGLRVQVTANEFVQWWLTSSCRMTIFTYGGSATADQPYDRGTTIWIPARAGNSCIVYVDGNYDGKPLATRQFSITIN